MEYFIPKDGDLPFTIHKQFFFSIAKRVNPLGLVACAFLFFISNQRVHAAMIPTVRVLVERDPAALVVQGFDLDLADARTAKRVAFARDRARLEFECKSDNRVRVRGLAARPREFQAPLKIVSLGGFLRVGTAQYRDELYVYSMNRECMVVNHVDLEKYVAGLLHSEMNASWSLPTLKAQAVAARTYAIYQMRDSLRPFDVNSTVKDQVYEGAQKERYRAMQAVLETRGQIVTYNGKPIKAFYHSTCGGMTESADRVWGAKHGDSVRVRCGYCERSPRFSWRFEILKSELEHKLRQVLAFKGNLLFVNVLGRNNIGRADQVEVRTTRESLRVPAVKVRDLLGTRNVMSTDFSIIPDSKSVVFHGRGSGHGVGMCQYGAKRMGELGRDHKSILRHYYPRADLTSLY